MRCSEKRAADVIVEGQSSLDAWGFTNLICYPISYFSFFVEASRGHYDLQED